MFLSYTADRYLVKGVDIMSDASLGKAGEEAAVKYLCHTLGYTVLSQNYRNRLGEIDIIAQDGDTLVFVEVKTRRSQQCGRPAEAVENRKQRKLSLVALSYMTRHHCWHMPCRFDVVEVVPSPQGFHLHHIRHAFLSQA